jgi:RNA polymerase sigma-70 factor, ECF subfamily
VRKKTHARYLSGGKLRFWSMNRTANEPLGDLPGGVQESWQLFLTVYEPLRPDLYRYCRYLSRSPWDAEDLAQDVMARGFVMLGRMGRAPPNPRAWLFRVASNLWIDQARRAREAPSHTASLETATPEPRAPREAAGTLIVRLSPQERAALVLKDVFDLTLEETAEALSTSVGAIKSALSRGRGKLIEPEPEAAAELPTGALDAFCSAFNARDLDRLAGLLLDTAVVEVVGVAESVEGERRGVLYGMVFGSQRLAEADKHGGIDPRFMQGVLPSSPRIELRVHRGEALLLSWYAHTGGEAVRAVTRVEVVENRISRLKNYFFTPDFLIEVCRELDVPCRVNGYRHCLSLG